MESPTGTEDFHMWILSCPGVTQKFIETTMTGYEKSIWEDFGNVVPGVFTDEPEIDSSGGYPLDT